MPETRPISERINLVYVKRKHWPQTTMFRVSLLLGGTVLLGALALEAGQTTGAFPGNAFFSSGPVTHAHSMFGDNCIACHVSDPLNPTKLAFNLPVNDDKCLDCHETYAVTHDPHQSLYNGKERLVEGMSKPVMMSSRCGDCHVEHQGHDFNLNRVSDGVCTQCHTDLQAHGYAAGKAPAQPKLANVSSFSSDHPDWVVLPNKTSDTAAYNFGHKKHNDPESWPNMQELLRGIKDRSPAGRALHIEDKGGKLAMSCTFCHDVDAHGAYMKPINFEQHCADCHTGTVGVIGVSSVIGDKGVSEGKFTVISSDINSGLAKRLVRPQQVPHGSSHQVAELVDKAIAQFIADDPPQFKPEVPKPEGEADKPADEGGSRRRRGAGGSPDEAKPAEPAPAQDAQPSGSTRRRGGTSTEAAAPPAPTAKLRTFADNAALQIWAKEQRKEALGKIQEAANCGHCHISIQPGPADATELFRISDQKIPSHWLTKSSFGHTAHAMVSCTQCHPAATASENTADVMLPSAVSCRECHHESTLFGTAGASQECVLCHSYHKPLPASVIGRKTIDQVRQGGSVMIAPAPKPAAPAPAKPTPPASN